MVYNIIIDKQIGAGDWWNNGYSKGDLRNDLVPFRNKHVDILISSPGGDVDDAIDMYQQLRDHGDVTVFIDGFTASAATIVAMGAKNIKMNKYSYLLIHKCSSVVSVWENLNADQIAEFIESLKKQKCTQDKVDNGIANLYADRCKKKCEEIKTLLDAAEWLTANECLDNGLIDEIIDGDPVVVDNSTFKIAAHAGYPKLPVAIQNRDNILSSFLDKIVNIFNKMASEKKVDDKSADQPEQQHDEVKSPITNTLHNMRKKFMNVCKILNIEDFELDEEKKSTTITDAQLTAVEDRITVLETQAAADKKTIDDQRAQIEALEKGAAVEETARTEDNDDTDKISAKSMYDEVKDFI